jgi:hypothetical protein
VEATSQISPLGHFVSTPFIVSEEKTNGFGAGMPDFSWKNMPKLEKCTK